MAEQNDQLQKKSARRPRDHRPGLNSGFIGFPLVAQLFGPVNAGIGLALAMVVENFLTLPLSLALADSDLGEGAAGQGRAQRLRTALQQSLRSVLRNPMIWGIVAGFVFRWPAGAWPRRSRARRTCSRWPAPR